MTQLAWGTPGTRFFESGVDRGVLYVRGVGVAWNGLVSVKETPSGGDPQPYYLDGYKYLNVASDDEYVASLDAYSAPAEFGACDGTASIQNGLFATQQPRSSFGLSYRSKKGNDLSGIDLGYKIHLVYNALATPPDHSYNSLTNSSNLNTLTWSISTMPSRPSFLKPTAHFIVDSTLTTAYRLQTLEGILYGTDTTDPRLPDVEELLHLFRISILDITLDPVTGFNMTRDVTDQGDIEGVAGDGIYTIPVGSRLVPTATPGFFTLGA